MDKRNPQSTRDVPEARSDDAATQYYVRPEDVYDVASAIGSKPRWEIIEALFGGSKTIVELMDAVGKSKGTISAHLSQLEEAGVVRAQYTVSDAGGIEKQVSLATREVVLDLSESGEP